MQCKFYVKSCWCAANSSFAFWNLLENFFLPQLFSICGLLSLWMQKLWILRANHTHCIDFSEYNCLFLVSSIKYHNAGLSSFFLSEVSGLQNKVDTKCIV